MYLTNQVYELSEQFMAESTFVKMIPGQIKLLADEMLKSEPPNFPVPKVDDTNHEAIYNAVFIELVAASINYCYWYGKNTVRPNKSSSTFMYECLMNAFYDIESHGDYSKCIDCFIDTLSFNRFPLIEDRVRHLNELKSQNVEDITIDIVNNNIGFFDATDCDNDINTYMVRIITTIPGFAFDLFLKRASLFFIQLFRRFGWFSDQLHNLHVPADYQIPKMLEHNQCLGYNPYLRNIIATNQLIPKHSQMECEIRAATVLTMKRLCELTGWNIAEVDGYLFLKRHDAKQNFHLTITTDY